MTRWIRDLALEAAMLRWQSRPAQWLIGLAVLLALQISPRWLPTNDACSYLSMGRSLIQGRGMLNLGSAHWWYPPGYSLLISPVFLLGDRPFLALAVFQWLAVVAMMLGVYVWARRVVPEAALWIAAISVVNAGLWLNYRRTLSEVAFMAVLIWLVNVLHFAVESRKLRTLWGGVAVGMGLMMLLCLLRQIGVTMAGGVCACLFWMAISGRITWRRAIVVGGLISAVALLTTALVILREQRVAKASGESTHISIFTDSSSTFPESYLRGVNLVISDTGRVVIPGMFKSFGTPGKWLNINMAVYVPLSLLLVWGWWNWIRREPDMFAWAVPFYMLMLVAFACHSGARYIVPMIPALLVCLWYALKPLGMRRLGILGLMLMAHCVAAMAYWLAIDMPLAGRLHAQWPAVDAMAAQIQSDPGPVALVDSPMPFVGNMLALALDRPVYLRVEDMPAGMKLRWLAMPRDVPAPPGFTRRIETGDFQLLAVTQIQPRSKPD